jgi:hypothetical protein
MARNQSFDHTEVDKRHVADQHRVKVGVPLVRRPAPATRAAEVVDDYDDDLEDRGIVSGREVR